MTAENNPPSDEDLTHMHWKERWEYEAGRVSDQLRQYSEDDLVEMLNKDLTDSYFSLWHVLGEKGTPDKSALPVWEYLKRHPGEGYMLDRYHAADALFRILGMPDSESANPLRKRVQWDHDGEEARQEALLELKEIIKKKL